MKTRSSVSSSLGARPRASSDRLPRIGRQAGTQGPGVSASWAHRDGVQVAQHRQQLRGLERHPNPRGPPAKRSGGGRRRPSSSLHRLDWEAQGLRELRVWDRGRFRCRRGGVSRPQAAAAPGSAVQQVGKARPRTCGPRPAPVSRRPGVILPESVGDVLIEELVQDEPNGRLQLLRRVQGAAECPHRSRRAEGIAAAIQRIAIEQASEVSDSSP